MTEAALPIRLARAEDIPQLAAFRALFLRELGYDIDPVRCQAESEDLLTAHLNKSLHMLVAHDQDTLAACAFLQVVPQMYHPRNEHGPADDVFNVYTLPAYRQQGLAARLMQEMQALAKRLGLGFLRLNAAPAGRQLYSRMGFEEVTNAHPLMVLRLDG